jgi:double zinc ribbon protein
MLPLATFGIESSGLSLAVDLLILVVVVLYFALIYWTYADARRRIVDPWMIACATVASFFPFVGTIVYVVVRPPEYLEDVRERELEILAAEARLAQADGMLCPHCDYRIEREFVRCPSCLRKLKERCTNCARPLERTWTICPYCEADVPGLSAPRPRRRRSMATIEAEGAAGSTHERDGTLGELEAGQATAPPPLGSDSAGAPATPAGARSSRQGPHPRPTS